MRLDNGILYTRVPPVDEMPEPWRWPDFQPIEFTCRGSGEFYWHPVTFDAIQRARHIAGRPLTINSAHRSWLHNIAAGGAPRSAHLFIALDVSTRGTSRLRILSALERAGFSSFGYYQNFIHTDLRPGRRWFGSHAAKRTWGPLLSSRTPAS